MTRLHLLIVSFVAVAALLVGSGYSQEKKDAQPKVQLPATWGWAKIGLKADQKQKVYDVIGSYQTKIKDLQSKIEKLRDEEYAEAYKLLDDTQKAKVKKPYEPAKDEKKKDEKKKDEKKKDEIKKGGG